LLGHESVSAYVPYAPAALMSSTHTPMDVRAVKIGKVESNDEHHVLARKIKARTVRRVGKRRAAAERTEYSATTSTSTTTTTTAGVTETYEGDSDEFGEYIAVDVSLFDDVSWCTLE